MKDQFGHHFCGKYPSSAIRASDCSCHFAFALTNPYEADGRSHITLPLSSHSLGGATNTLHAARPVLKNAVLTLSLKSLLAFKEASKSNMRIPVGEHIEQSDLSSVHMRSSFPWEATRAFSFRDLSLLVDLAEYV